MHFFFQILNTMGQQVYFAVEHSSCLQRQCCGSIRDFEMSIQGLIEPLVSLRLTLVYNLYTINYRSEVSRKASR